MRRAILALALAACGSKRAAPAPKDAPVAASIDASTGFAPLGPAVAPPRTADGIPILEIQPGAADRQGDVRWLRASSQILEWTQAEASDGARIWWAMNREGDDLLVRDGMVREHVLRDLGATGPGCGAAIGGDLLLAAGARVWRIAPDGTKTETALPRTVASGNDCRAWLAADGTYRLALFGIVDWDGQAFTEDRGFFAGRTVTGGPGRPKYCFESCNATETQDTDPATKVLTDALGCTHAEWIAYGDRVAGSCGDKVVRYREGGKPEVIAQVPGSKMLNGNHDLAFTEDGAVVIALDYHFARYVVWPDGAAALTGERRLGPGEVMAKASPTVVVRGLGGAVPDAQVYAIPLGKDVGYGANGSTVGYSAPHRSDAAHQAQVDRARAVLGSGALIVAGEAVIDPSCGAVVRSPLGWEDTQMSDFDPPTLPALSPKAVTKVPDCLPITAAAALPGDPDFLLAISDGALWGAWLPAPLPLPGGSSFGEPSPPPAPQDPKPGAGWVKLADHAQTLAGIDARPAPGGEVEFAAGTWQLAGAMVVTLDDATVLVSRAGTMTLPPDTAPMAVGEMNVRAWGAVGGKLVDCAATCRVLDPGVPATIVGVVPRTGADVILGYDDGRVGVYTSPATGGDVTPRHAAADAIDALRAQRPR